MGGGLLRAAKESRSCAPVASSRTSAAFRIRSAACGTRHCVRRVLWCPEFPLVEALSSANSAEAPLFAAFTGPLLQTVRHRLRLSPSLHGPDRRDSLKISQGPDRRRTDGFSDTAGRAGISPNRCLRCCLRPIRKPRHPESSSFRCSSAPLPTLRLPPHGNRRTARGETWFGYSFVPGDFHPCLLPVRLAHRIPDVQVPASQARQAGDRGDRHQLHRHAGPRLPGRMAGLRSMHPPVVRVLPAQGTDLHRQGYRRARVMKKLLPATGLTRAHPGP